MLQLYIPNSLVDVNQISSLNVFGSLNIALSPLVAWAVIGLAGIIFFIISSVMKYHWRRFGFESLVMARAALIYFLVSTILFGGAIISLAVYLKSL